MKRSFFAVLAVAFGMSLAAIPVMAHHSFAAEYDSTKPITLTGVITRVEWMNPHVYFYLDVTDEKTSKISNWAFEMGPPGLLQKSGWTRNMMKIGDVVTVNGTLAKDGGKQANARNVVMTDTGKKLGAGSSEGNIP